LRGSLPLQVEILPDLALGAGGRRFKSGWLPRAALEKNLISYRLYNTVQEVLNPSCISFFFAEAWTIGGARYGYDPRIIRPFRMFTSFCNWPIALFFHFNFNGDSFTAWIRPNAVGLGWFPVW
jgi:hypothetical protein